MSTKIDHQNPYANVDVDRVIDDPDYFSKMSHDWVHKCNPTCDPEKETTWTKVEDNATNPGHYNSIPEHLQHWNVVHKMGWDYYLGNATKYIWRAGKKSSAHQSIAEKEIEDLNKAIVYLQKKIDLLKVDL